MKFHPAKKNQLIASGPKLVLAGTKAERLATQHETRENFAFRKIKFYFLKK
jgi:hypothetical protein